jgi:hypothetical protein
MALPTKEQRALFNFSLRVALVRAPELPSRPADPASAAVAAVTPL